VVEALLAGLGALLGRLPWRALRWFGAALGWIAGSALRIRRAHVEGSMRTAGVADPAGQARAMYASLGTSALEFLWLANRGADATQHVTIAASSAADWRRARARGRGVVLAASHTGNWDLAASAIARDVGLLVVTKHLSAPGLDRFWQSTRAGAGVTLVGGRGAMARGREFLRGGGAVAMMIDQAPGSSRHAVPVEFLGRRAFADRAPAALAATTGAPLVIAAARRDRRGAHVLHVLGVLEPPPRPTRRWIVEATICATRALDDFVRRYPSQWLWLHRRWKNLDASAGSSPASGVDRIAGGATLARSWRKIRSSSQDAASRAG
jgi:KDO2-lipid IV(A) lauroyltransferase